MELALGGDYKLGEVKYLIDNWGAFLQQIVYLIGRGYKSFCIVNYPIEKKHKYKDIDRKLIGKYQCDLNKNQKYYRKQNGYANYSFLRYKNIAIVLKTDGNNHSKIKGNDVFLDVNNNPISIRITDWTVFEIKYVAKRISVYLSRESYENILGSCLESLDDKRFTQMYVLFNNLNGFPAWSGIIQQRRRMLSTLKKEAKRKGLYKLIDFNKFDIKTRRHIYTVFDEIKS